MIVVNAVTESRKSGVVQQYRVAKSVTSIESVTIILGRNLFASASVDGLYSERVVDECVSVADITDWQCAVGAFLSVVETHGVAERTVVCDLRGCMDFERFEQELSEWSGEARREWVQDRVACSTDPRRDCLESVGSIRVCGHGFGEDSGVVSELLDASVQKPGCCYESVVTALEDHGRDDRVQYVEGVVLPKYGGVVREHAWLEVSGKVVEPTWGWHRPSPPQSAIYYGVSFDPEEVLELVGDRAGYGSVIADQNQVLRYFRSEY